MTELTRRQGDILSFIIHCGDVEGVGPSIRDIGERFGIHSTNGVNDHLLALERKGYLERHRIGGVAIARAMRATTAGRRALGLPAKPDLVTLVKSAARVALEIYQLSPSDKDYRQVIATVLRPARAA